MKDTLTILRKEFYNLFKDKRTVFSIFVLPVIIFIGIFFAIGTMMEQEEQKLEQTVYKIYTNEPAILNTLKENMTNTEIEIIDTVENMEEALRDGDIHLGLIFQSGDSFDQYLQKDSPPIEIYSYSGSNTSENITSIIRYQLKNLRDQYLKDKLVASGTDPEILERPIMKTYNVATEKEQAGSFLGMILPYMLIIYLFSSSFSVGFDTTAGEKERQTLTILLSNQVSRTSIAWAKILYIMMINVTTATISLIAFTIGFTQLMPDIPGNILEAFTPATVTILFLSVISMAVLIAAIIVVVGIFAKSVKEATSYTLPIYIIVLIVGVMGMQPQAFRETTNLAFVPLINGIVTLKQLFTTPNLPMYNFTMLLIVNFAVTALLVILASKMFNNEKYVFRTEN